MLIVSENPYGGDVCVVHVHVSTDSRTVQWSLYFKALYFKTTLITGDCEST